MSVENVVRLPPLFEAVADAEAETVAAAGPCKDVAVLEPVEEWVAAANSADCEATIDLVDETAAETAEDAVDDEDVVEAVDEAVDEEDVEEVVDALPIILCTYCTTVSVVLVDQYERWAVMLLPVEQQIGSSSSHHCCSLSA